MKLASARDEEERLRSRKDGVQGVLPSSLTTSSSRGANIYSTFKKPSLGLWLTKTPLETVPEGMPRISRSVSLIEVSPFDHAHSIASALTSSSIVTSTSTTESASTAGSGSSASSTGSGDTTSLISPLSILNAKYEDNTSDDHDDGYNDGHEHDDRSRGYLALTVARREPERSIIQFETPECLIDRLQCQESLKDHSFNDTKEKSRTFGSRGKNNVDSVHDIDVDDADNADNADDADADDVDDADNADDAENADDYIVYTMNNGKQYTVGSEIGSGSFSTVYQMFDEQGTVYAGKLIPKLQLKPKELNRMWTEVAIHRHLSHPGIVRMQEYIETEDELVVVTEYCNGGDLWDLVLKRRILPISDIRFFMSQIINAVAYLHSLGITHRDLKPHNILLGENMKPKICDFGMASRSEKMHHVCGTPNYMAPEIIAIRTHPQNTYTKAVDIWALGCLMYLLSYGRAPFSDSSVDATYQRILNHSYKFPRKPEYPREYRKLISRMLKHNPADRLTANQLLQHPFFAGEGETNTPRTTRCL